MKDVVEDIKHFMLDNKSNESLLNNLMLEKLVAYVLGKVRIELEIG